MTAIRNSHSFPRMTTAAPITLQHAPRPEICLQLVSNPAYLCGVRELIGLFCKRVGFPEAHASRIVLAVDEALANVMTHGYDRRLDGQIEVSLFKDIDAATGIFGSLRIIIEDDGKQTDPAIIKSRDLDDIRPGGLGVHIIKEVMDSVKYEQREPRGMRLTMCKHLPEETALPASEPSCCGVSPTNSCSPAPALRPFDPQRGEQGGTQPIM